ncbi:MAG TPA: hypothetical protein ENL20_09225 [Candidatus Cloacimonetes bacterium]|nr:hypothetical protein [Candidatus Cloacimonadota bacterium]
MKTLILEKMPDLFWEKIVKKKWDSYFITNKNFNKDNIEILIIRTQTVVDDKFMENYKNLKLIIRAGSGFDNIDILAAKKRNVVVCTTPEANALSAYEHTISFIFALIKNHQKSKKNILANKWKSGLSFNWEISDLKVLVVGVGRVGTKVAKTLKYLGAEVCGVDPYLSQIQWKDKYIKQVSYIDGLKWCNLLTYHCPLTRETRNYFSVHALKNITDPIWLVNTARGPIIEEKAIENGLNLGKILGFAADVFENEPWIIKNFGKNDNIFLTPHNGSYTIKAKNRLASETLKVWSGFVFERKIFSEINYDFY